ncbi:MAG: XkdX family protein [Angelakisella sp.]
MFKLIAKYYRMGIYTDADIDMYVQCGTITQAQADEIKAGRA